MILELKFKSVLLPAYNSSNSYQKMPLFNILSDLCGHPSYKMLTCRSLPQFNPQKSSFQQYSTDLMLKYLHQLNHTGIYDQKLTSSDLFLGKFNENAGNLNFKQCSNYCFARSVYIRGRDAKGTNVSLLNEDSQYSNYLSPSLRFNNYWSPRGIKKFENFATSLSNDQSYLQQVDNVVDKSWMMFNNNGYIHNYSKYNIEKEDFLTAFSQTEQIIHSYKSLSQ